MKTLKIRDDTPNEELSLIIESADVRGAASVRPERFVMTLASIEILLLPERLKVSLHCV